MAVRRMLLVAAAVLVAGCPGSSSKAPPAGPGGPTPLPVLPSGPRLVQGPPSPAGPGGPTPLPVIPNAGRAAPAGQPSAPLPR